MKKKPLIVLLCSIILVLTVSFLFSYALRGYATSSDVFEMQGATLVRYRGESEVVTIPANVTTVGQGAFEGNSYVKKIIVSSSVKTIEYNAFSECSALIEIDIPDSVEKIGSAAFANCKQLCDVSIGKNLQEMGSGVFAGCDSLQDISVNLNNTNFTCVDGVLYDAARTKIYQVLAGREKPYYIMPASVDTIGQYAFWGNQHLEHVKLSDKIISIPSYAFSNAAALQTVSMSFNTEDINMKAFEDCESLEQIYIPDSVSYIHETAFDGCDKLNIYSEYYTKGASFARDHGITLLAYAKYPLNQAELAQEEYYVMKKKEEELAKLLEEAALEKEVAKTEQGLIGKTSLVDNEAVVMIDRFDTDVHYGDHVITMEEITANTINGRIADNLFYMRSDLKEVMIPQETLAIGKFTFARTGLKSVIIPEGVTEIGYGAFYHCENLSEISIPSTVIKIEKNAFEHTAWLEKWYAESDEDYLIVGDGVLIAYKGEADAYQKPSNVKCIACDIP